MRPSFCDDCLIGGDVRQVFVNLAKSCLPIGAKAVPGWNLPERHLILDWIYVDVTDCYVLPRSIDQRNPSTIRSRLLRVWGFAADRSCSTPGTSDGQLESSHSSGRTQRHRLPSARIAGQVRLPLFHCGQDTT